MRPAAPTAMATSSAPILNKNVESQTMAPAMLQRIRDSLVEEVIVVQSDGKEDSEQDGDSWGEPEMHTKKASNVS